MTRAKLQRLHELLIHAQTVKDCWAVNDAVLMVEAELAKPEAREWRVQPYGRNGLRLTAWTAADRNEAMVLSGEMEGLRVVIESRTPAGPWEAEK